MNTFDDNIFEENEASSRYQVDVKKLIEDLDKRVASFGEDFKGNIANLQAQLVELKLLKM